jgi:flagellar protein FliS
MAYVSAKSAYQQVEVTTLSPQRLVVLLYTHLLSNLKLARHHLEQHEVEQRIERMMKAFAIIQELHVTLDYEAGGPIARNLAQLYAFWMQEIVKLNSRPDRAALDKLVHMVAEMHGAWVEAAEKVTAEGGVQPPAVARTA